MQCRLRKRSISINDSPWSEVSRIIFSADGGREIHQCIFNKWLDARNGVSCQVWTQTIIQKFTVLMISNTQMILFFEQSPYKRIGRNSAGWCPRHWKCKGLCNSVQNLHDMLISEHQITTHSALFRSNIGGRDWIYWRALVLSMAHAADPRTARAGYLLPCFQPRSCETIEIGTHHSTIRIGI